MSELLSCPFCGGEAETCHVTQLWEPRDTYWVKCKNCHISGIHHTTEAEAVEAWNTRQLPRAFDSVETAQRVAELEMELEDARAEIRKLERRGEYMVRQIAKAKEALR